MRRATLVALAALLAPEAAFAWGASGHSIGGLQLAAVLNAALGAGE